MAYTRTSEGNITFTESGFRQFLVYIREELIRIESESIAPLARVMALETLHAEPAYIRDGLIAYADGTDWDPGSGEGPYMYFNSQWNFLA